MAILSRDGGVIDANRGFLQFCGTSEHPTPATVINAAACFVEPRFDELCQTAGGDSGICYRGLITLAHPSGPRRTFSGCVRRYGAGLFLSAELDIAAFERLSGENDFLTAQLIEAKRQLSQHVRALESARRQAELAKATDALTDLPVRSQLDEKLSEVLQHWERFKRPLALLIMDLDEFHEVNERYGREAADEILRHVATIINQSVRSLDYPVRYGGKEFAVLLPETNEMGALIAAERLRMELEEQIILPMVRPLTASFGVATYVSGETREQFYGRAERAVRHSKVSGRNRVTLAGVVEECDHLYHGAGGIKEKQGEVAND